MLTTPRPHPRCCDARSVVIAIALSLFATGCTTVLKTIPADFQASPEKSAVVIGRVDWVTATGGTDLTLTVLTRATDQVKLHVKNETNGRTYILTAVEPGGPSDFYVAAPPGQYRLMEVRFGTLTSVVKAAFHVPPAPAVYVGTLRFVAGEEPSFAARLRGARMRGRWSVHDGRHAVIERFRARYPGLTDPVVASLMRSPTAAAR
jgi:hypothetical protein